MQLQLPVYYDAGCPAQTLDENPGYGVRAEKVATSTLKKESMVRVRRVHLCMDA